MMAFFLDSITPNFKWKFSGNLIFLNQDHKLVSFAKLCLIFVIFTGPLLYCWSYTIHRYKEACPSCKPTTVFHIKCVCTVIFYHRVGALPNLRVETQSGRQTGRTSLQHFSGELTISPWWRLRCQLVDWKSPDSKGKCWRHLWRHCAVLSVVVGVKVFVTCLQLPRRPWQRTRLLRDDWLLLVILPRKHALAALVYMAGGRPCKLRHVTLTDWFATFSHLTSSRQSGRSPAAVRLINIERASEASDIPLLSDKETIFVCESVSEWPNT